MQELNLSLLSASNYRIYNYEIAKKIGIKEAIFLADIVAKYLYFESRGMLVDNVWFFSTADDIYETTALNRRIQENCIKKLKKLNYIDVKLKGIPCKRHFCFKGGLRELFFGYETGIFNPAPEQKAKTRCVKTVKLCPIKDRNSVSEKSEAINNINNSIKNNTICSFDSFWTAYDKKIDRPKCEKLWSKLALEEQRAVLDNIPRYLSTITDKQYQKYPATYLRNRSWENEINTEPYDDPKRIKYDKDGKMIFDEMNIATWSDMRVYEKFGVEGRKKYNRY